MEIEIEIEIELKMEMEMEMELEVKEGTIDESCNAICWGVDSAEQSILE